MSTSCFLRFQLASSSSCRSRSCASYAQTKSEFRGTRVPMAVCSRQENSSQQRFLPPSAMRLNVSVPIRRWKVKTAVQSQNNEIATTNQVSGSLYNFHPPQSASIGLISLMIGLVIGYALNHKEKAGAHAVIETMRGKVEALEEQIFLLQTDLGGSDALMNLESGISKLSAELYEASELLKLKTRVDDDEQHKEVETLTRELETAKEDLQKSEAKFQSMCQDLKDAQKDSAIMQRKWGSVQKRLNTAENDLDVDKQLVASLKNDVRLLENQVFMEREVRKTHEASLREANKSLDSMKQRVFVLTNQLKSFTSRVDDLHHDKEDLQKLLTDERKVSSETKKNLEDARNQITKLGQEREDLESKANKLKKELDSVKGEILNLKGKKNSSSELDGK